MKKLISASSIMYVFLSIMLLADPSGKTCADDSRCNDGNACTDDRCVSGTCSYINKTGTQSCYTDARGNPLSGTPGTGKCRSGIQTCSNGVPGPCTGAVGASIETCGRGDENCNGTIDEPGATGCSTFYADKDGDGFGSSRSKCICKPDPPYTAENSSDCDDGNPKMYPGAREHCGDGIDNNCNGSIDEEGALDCRKYYYDRDGDGSGTTAFKCLCRPEGPYRTLTSNDCNDDNKDISTRAGENCSDGVDNNCNGLIDGQDPACSKTLNRPSRETFRKIKGGGD
jgi:hypothetical protein